MAEEKQREFSGSEQVICPDCGNDDPNQILLVTKEIGGRERRLTEWIGWSCAKCDGFMKLRVDTSYDSIEA